MSAVLALLMTSCAYQFTGSRADIPGVSPHVQKPYRIFVSTADNKTDSVGMESELPAALARVISGLSNVQLVDSESDANLILAPRVTELGRGRGLGTLQGTADTANAGGLARGAVTAREFAVTSKVEIDLYETVDPAKAQISEKDSGNRWDKRWTKTFASVGNYSSSLRLIPSKGSSSSSIINHSRERLVLRTMSEDIARQVREQVFQGF